MFISLLVCFIAIIVMAVALIIIFAPFSIEIRTSKKSAIKFKFGNCLPYVWVCLSWFNITKHTFDEDENMYSEIIYSFWESNGSLYINGKTYPDYDVDEYLSEQEDARYWDERYERSRDERDQFDKYM